MTLFVQLYVLVVSDETGYLPHESNPMRGMAITVTMVHEPLRVYDCGPCMAPAGAVWVIYT